jgi:hypothetical protein
VARNCFQAISAHVLVGVLKDKRTGGRHLASSWLDKNPLSGIDAIVAADATREGSEFAGSKTFSVAKNVNPDTLLAQVPFKKDQVSVLSPCPLTV